MSPLLYSQKQGYLYYILLICGVNHPFMYNFRWFIKLTSFIFQQSSEEDPDEGVKELVEIVLKKLVCVFVKYTLKWKQYTWLR